MKNSNQMKNYEANMKNVIVKYFSSVTNQITAIERYETKKLNMLVPWTKSLVGKRYCHDGFS